MTTYNKATLKTFFENNDVPTGQNYADFIDSYVNIVETAQQNMAGPLYATEFVTPRVSATDTNITNALTATNGVISGNFRVNGITSAESFYAESLSASAGTINLLTADSITASANRSSFNIDSVGIVSALGSTQATAAPLIYATNRGAGIADGVDTGFALPANRAGLTQYLFNGNASANLWPPTDGTINALSTNAPFPLAANTLYTIKHITASAYAVK